jgi:alpha-beta hydrolase superfamily lysophospholipase
VRETTSTFDAPDGAVIFRRRWDPDEGTPVRAVAHVVHGMAEHSGRYARLAEALTTAGLVVHAHDHRGHGRTAAAADRGHLGDHGWSRAVGDLRRLVLEELAEQRGVPFVLIAHSMGSFFAQELLFELSDRLAAAVLSGSNGKPTPIAAAGRLVARAERLRLGPRGHSPVLSKLSFEAFNRQFAPNRTAFDWLSRDPAEVDAYVADPLCGFPCSTTTWVEVLDGLSAIASPERQRRIRKDLPVYIVAGSEDAASGNAKGVRQLASAYRAAGLHDVTERYYPGARHEVLNETNRDEVTRDLLVFVDRVLQRASTSPTP